MLLPLFHAVVRSVGEGSERKYLFLHGEQNQQTLLSECALTRTYQRAIEEGRLVIGDLAQVHFVNEKYQSVQTTNVCADAYDRFFQVFSNYHVFGASQHMAEEGKVLISKYPVDVILTRLYGAQLTGRIDTHKFLKILQIMCQPGRLNGRETITLEREGRTPQVHEAIQPIEPFTVNCYIDEKRPSEDGVIYVDPTYWDTVIIDSYSTTKHPIAPNITLIKVNSCEADLTIKAVLKKASAKEWQAIQDRSGRDDFQFLLCGNAIKDQNGYEEHEVYEMDHTRFAYHTDSQI